MAKAKMTLPSDTLDLTLEAGKRKAMTAAATSKGEAFNVRVDQLRTIPGFNVRIRETDDYRSHVEELKQSIRENGFYPNKPLAGYIGKDGEEDVIFVTDGHTRLEAVQEINAEDVDGKETLETLPLVLKPADSSINDLTIALVQDNNGRPLLPYEMGIVVRRLQNARDGEGQPLFSKADIARKLSITERYIDDLNVLVSAPAKVRNAVLNGEVAATLAIQELRKNPKKAEERITTAVTKAKASGKSKATKKDIVPSVKMKKVAIRVSLATGDSIKDVLKSMATQIRAAVAHGSDDVLLTDGTISAMVEVPEPASEAPAPAKAAKPERSKGPSKAKAAAAKKGAAKAPAKKTAAAPAEEPEAAPAGDDEGEPVRLPPAVPTVDSDDPDDI